MGEGLASFQNRLRRLPQQVSDGIAPDLVAAAEDVAEVQRILAPEKTGALMASIVVTGPGEAPPAYSQPGGAQVVPEGAVAVTAGNTDVRYPHIVEFGSTRTAPHPFFWPGFRMTRDQAAAKIKNAMRRIIRTGK